MFLELSYHQCKYFYDSWCLTSFTHRCRNKPLDLDSKLPSFLHFTFHVWQQVQQGILPRKDCCSENLVLEGLKVTNVAHPFWSSVSCLPALLTFEGASVSICQHTKDTKVLETVQLFYIIEKFTYFHTFYSLIETTNCGYWWGHCCCAIFLRVHEDTFQIVVYNLFLLHSLYHLYQALA